jgi:hypothetical protein
MKTVNEGLDMVLALRIIILLSHADTLIPEHVLRPLPVKSLLLF